MSIPLIGWPIHDLLKPERCGYLRSDCGDYVTATTPDGQTIRILRQRVRRGMGPAQRPARYAKNREDQDPELLRLATANGLTYAQALEAMR